MAFVSSSEEGAVAATDLEGCLDVEVDEEAVLVDLFLFAASASAAVKVL